MLDSFPNSKLWEAILDIYRPTQMMVSLENSELLHPENSGLCTTSLGAGLYFDPGSRKSSTLERAAKWVLNVGEQYWEDALGGGLRLWPKGRGDHPDYESTVSSSGSESTTEDVNTWAARCKRDRSPDLYDDEDERACKLPCKLSCGILSSQRRMLKEHMPDCGVEPELCPDCGYVLKPEIRYSRDIPYENAILKELGDYILDAFRESHAQSAFAQGCDVANRQPTASIADEHSSIVPVECLDSVAAGDIEAIFLNASRYQAWRFFFEQDSILKYRETVPREAINDTAPKGIPDCQPYGFIVEPGAEPRINCVNLVCTQWPDVPGKLAVLLNAFGIVKVNLAVFGA